jgi:polyhydroxybutyrate depolymerase
VSLPRRLAPVLIGLTVALAATSLSWFAASASSSPSGVGQLVGRAGHTELVRLVVGGWSRDYRLFVPRPLPAGPRPLLLALHPLGGNARRWEAVSGLDAGAERLGAYVAYPDGVAHSWNAGTCCGGAVRQRVDDVGFLTAVVADIAAHHDVDLSRVATSGFSNGALMSYRMLCERAAVVHVAVAMAGDEVAPSCLPTRPVSILHVHGLRDAVIPYPGRGPSSLDRFGFPPAPQSVSRIAALDGCTSARSVPLGDGQLWSATGCRADARVELRAVDGLGHSWPAGPRARARYGIDMSTQTWAFAEALWSEHQWTQNSLPSGSASTTP